MAKRKKLKQRLKAADRRRKQRADGSGVIKTVAPEEPVSVDVVELVGQAILTYSDSRPDTSDTVVLAALRSSQKGSKPSGNDAIKLADAIDAINGQNGVTERSFRNAINQMIAILSEHQDTKKPKAFLEYLRLIAS